MRRYGIVFTIALAISIASFIDHLKMGRDAIDFLFGQLARIHALSDVARFVANTIHAALDWWRGNVNRFLQLLPLRIPTWAADPLSVLAFGLSRSLNRVAAAVVRAHRLHVSTDKFNPGFISGLQQDAVQRLSQSRRRYLVRLDEAEFSLGRAQKALRSVVIYYVLPIVVLIVADNTYAGRVATLRSELPFLLAALVIFTGVAALAYGASKVLGVFYVRAVERAARGTKS